MSEYQKRIPFTQEQMELLMQNPYTVKVSPRRIIFSLAFKEFAMREIAKPEMTNKKVFQKAGYDVDLLGHERMKSIMRNIKKEAASPGGLQAPKVWTRDAELARLAKEDYTKKQTKAALREMHKRILHLEQQIAFLKKIHPSGPEDT